MTNWTRIRTRADLPERGDTCWVWCVTDGAPQWQVRLASRDLVRDGRWNVEDRRGGRILNVYAWMPGPVVPEPPERRSMGTDLAKLTAELRAQRKQLEPVAQIFREIADIWGAAARSQRVTTDPGLPAGPDDVCTPSGWRIPKRNEMAWSGFWGEFRRERWWPLGVWDAARHMTSWDALEELRRVTIERKIPWEHGFTLADIERIEKPWIGRVRDESTGEYRHMTLADLDRAIEAVDARP